MFRHLQIYDPRERMLVGLADLALAPVAWLRRQRASEPTPVRRVLLMRLERIGDLLMVLDAIRDARASSGRTPRSISPSGSWNAADREADSGDLADRSGRRAMARRAADAARCRPARCSGKAVQWRESPLRPRREFRARHPQQLSGLADAGAAAIRILDRRRRAVPDGRGAVRADDARQRNARALIARAAGRAADAARNGAGGARLVPPPDAEAAAARRASADDRRPFIGVHASGGRESKQWHLDRFAAVAATPGRSRARRSSSPARPRIDRWSTQSSASWRACRSSTPAERSICRRSPRSSRGSISSSRATPDRCTSRPPSAHRSSRCSARRILFATDRSPRISASSASICRAARAGACACRPSAAADTCRTASTASASRPSSPPRSSCWTRRRRARPAVAVDGADDRLRHGAGPIDPGHLDVAALARRARRGAGRGQPVDQAAASRPLRRPVDARALHVSRRLALVVHRALSAQDAPARTRRRRRSSRSRPRASATRRPGSTSATPTPSSGLAAEAFARAHGVADRRARGPGTRTRSQLVELSDRV